jgi:thiol:disulfide interchange protein DsbD
LATLLADAPQGIVPGQSFWLGLQLQHQAHWHTYWRNPGDSGLPTELQWNLPKGMTAGDIIWPVPKKIPIGTLANFGYEDTVLLVVPIKVSTHFKPIESSDLVNIQLQANWLVCKQECIPQEGKFQMALPLKGATVPARADFAKALNLQATPVKGQHIAKIAQDGRSLQLTLAALPSELQSGDWTVFPQTANVMQNNASPEVEKTSAAGQALQMRLRISSERMDSPRHMNWLLVAGKAEAPTGQQWTLTTPVEGAWQEFSEPLQTPALNLQAPMRNASTSVSAPWATWLWALLGALLGGLLLNLMPCVFPVLAIKLIGITQHADSPKAMKQSAWAFSAGVLMSFLLLGGLMLALRAAGSQMGWGFQLQSPWVVGVLAMLFAVMGLNLSGVFEFGSFVPSSVAGHQWSSPVLNSWWSGVFAVVIASPCTAPFMGASLGLAIGLPTWQALPIFGAMGVGMALPFMAVSINSNWVQRLPRPGAWMVSFRQLMAFPMYATVIWLVWVLGQQVGQDGVAGFLACLLSLSLLLWAFTQPGRFGRAIQVLAALCMAAAFWHWVPAWTQVEAPPLQAAEFNAPSGKKEGSAEGKVDGLPSSRTTQWESWSEDKLANARASGRPVFVDFTAAWCVTCQFNKKTTFSDVSILSAFAAKNVLLLRADWTRYDPAITRALNALGRNGVPVYAWYAPGQDATLLSELPSVDDIQKALSQVKNSPSI